MKVPINVHFVGSEYKTVWQPRARYHIPLIRANRHPPIVSIKTKNEKADFCEVQLVVEVRSKNPISEVEEMFKMPCGIMWSVFRKKNNDYFRLLCDCCA